MSSNDIINKNIQTEIKKEIQVQEKNTNPDNLIPLEELWNELASLSRNVSYDNKGCEIKNEPYPISVREVQLSSLKALIYAIEVRHKVMKIEEVSKSS